jgi:phosphoribosylformylglycinamidine (FGAM) synthase-like enzyme
MEDGSKLSGDAASGNYVIMLAYTTVANNKVKTIAAVGNISKTSGSFGTKYDDWASPTLEFTSALASADLSIPAGLFDMYNATTNAGGILDATAVGASQVIPTQSSYLRKYFLKKSS